MFKNCKVSGQAGLAQVHCSTQTPFFLLAPRSPQRPDRHADDDHAGISEQDH
jgi:hypothetical protein